MSALEGIVRPSRRVPSAILPRRLSGRGTVWVGCVIVACVVVACTVIPLVWPYSPNSLVAAPLQPPSGSHIFGTDLVGRDVFVRTMQAGRIDLLVVVIAVSLSAAIGSVLGMLAAFSGRWVDPVIMRLADAVIAFPFVVLVLTIVILVGASAKWGPLPPGLPAVLFALVITDWAVYARLTRAQGLSLRDREFVVAARILGYSRRRIIVRHLLPNVVGPVGAYMATDAVIVVLTTAALPFLGAGIQPPTPEWGAMMAEGSQVINIAWWIIVFPGAVLAIAAIGLSLIADGLLGRER